MEAKCPHCGDYFTPNHRQRIYCSNKCKDAFNNRKRLKQRELQNLTEYNELLLSALLFEMKMSNATFEDLESYGVNLTNYSFKEKDPDNPECFTLYFGTICVRRTDINHYSIYSNI